MNLININEDMSKDLKNFSNLNIFEMLENAKILI